MTTEATIAKSTQMIGLQAAPLRLSYKEYLEWDYECGLTEWVDGEVIFHMPPKRAHQQIIAFLDRLLGVFVEIFNLGVVQIAPFTMRLIEGGSAREPDLFFIA